MSDEPPTDELMPLIPLYNPAAAPDAWHAVHAPGGYEWWYFDAEDRATDTQIVAIFMQGFIFHPGYLRAIDRFNRRPTKTPPPLPADWPCAYFIVYKNGRIAHQFITQYPADDFSASADVTDVAIGLNRLQTTANGGWRITLEGSPWKLTPTGPKTLGDQTLSADLTFTPRWGIDSGTGCEQRRFLSREMTAADHFWVVAAPACDVSGVVRVDANGPGETSEPVNLTFSGSGYHDHNYGTGPIGPGLHRWVWGRAIFDDRVLTFHHAKPTDSRLPPDSHLLSASSAGRHDLPITDAKVDWAGRTVLNLRYPKSIQFGDALRLSRPRVIDATPFYLRMIYEAISDGRTGTAFCETAHPHRLRWPLLGRMIEMSIDKRT